MNERIRLRVKFRKFGSLRFIGHLDVMRFFQKAIRRAEIDVAYTGGFSPHQIMSFASPLSIGLESNGEYMDIEVNSLISTEDIKERLNRASVPGMEIISVKMLPKEAGNAMASVAAAGYDVSFRGGRKPDVNFTALVEAYLSQDKILMQKETKKGQKVLDLKEGIYELRWEDDHFEMLIDASSAGNIKPIYIIETLFSQNGLTLTENSLFITRQETYTNVGTAENKKLVPLDAVGVPD